MSLCGNLPSHCGSCHTRHPHWGSCRTRHPHSRSSHHSRHSPSSGRHSNCCLWSEEANFQSAARGKPRSLLRWSATLWESGTRATTSRFRSIATSNANVSEFCATLHIKRIECAVEKMCSTLLRDKYFISLVAKITDLRPLSLLHPCRVRRHHQFYG